MAKRDNGNVTVMAPAEGTVITKVRETGEHKATFCKDNYNGRWSIRVTGPTANRFAGRIIPVVRSSGEIVYEETGNLQWTGVDDGSVIASDAGKNVAIYGHKPKPRQLDEDIPF